MRHTNAISAPVLCLFAACALFAQSDVLTGGYSNNRSGANLSETKLTPATVNKSSFTRLFNLAVDGQIYAQPLYLHGVSLPGRGTHNVLFAASMHNTVYAFDADTPGLPLWSVNLGPAVPSDLYASDDGPYRDITVENGILGTPVIDGSTGTLYAVAATWENGSFLYRLHALDVATGQERFGAPSVITAQVSGAGDSSHNGIVPFVAQQHLQRPALLLLNGAVYIGFGAHGDATPFHGWIMAYSAYDVRRPTAVFNATPDGSGGSFWQSGRGLTADDAGNIFAVSSNGDTDNLTNFGDSVLKLNPDLTLADWFSPSNVQTLNQTDDDLGSLGALLIPGTSYVVTGGKEGKLYLMNQDPLGHLTPTDSQIPQTFAATNFGLFNVALWSRPDGAILYTHGANETIRAWKFNGSSFNTNPLTQSTDGFTVPYQGMSLSANGSASGILWVTQPVGYRLPSDGHLVAYDAADLSKILYDSAANPDDSFGALMKFANPTVANSKVYVPTGANSLAVYGLKTDAPSTRPLVTAVVNAASFAGGAIAPGEIVALLGQNLGGALVSSAFDSADQLPSQVVNTQVTFNGIAAPLLYSSATAIAAIVPFEISGAAATVQVSANGLLSAAQTVPLQPALPGIFTADASGVGPGAILNLDYSLNSRDHPADAGSFVVIYATGAGATPKARTGRRATEADAFSGPVSASVNGQPAEVLYAGAAPGLVNGAVQVNVRLPQGISGDVPVVITINGQSSPATVTVSVK